MKYILDTDICIYLRKGQYDLPSKVEKVSVKNCFISEITVAEMKCGIDGSDRRDETMLKTNSLIARFNIIPIWSSLDIYAKEKMELKKNGALIGDFDILLADTALTHNLTLVTNNIRHFERFERLRLENWARPELVPIHILKR